MRHEIGLDTLMWGTDYPHPEGSWPDTENDLRETFSGSRRTRWPPSWAATRRSSTTSTRRSWPRSSPASARPRTGSKSSPSRTASGGAERHPSSADGYGPVRARADVFHRLPWAAPMGRIDGMSSRLRDEILELSAEERMDLVEEVWDSISAEAERDGATLPLSDAQKGRTRPALGGISCRPRVSWCPGTRSGRSSGESGSDPACRVLSRCLARSSRGTALVRKPAAWSWGLVRASGRGLHRSHSGEPEPVPFRASRRAQSPSYSAFPARNLLHT